MSAIAFELALHERHYEPMVHRFGQDVVMVAKMLRQGGGSGGGLWDDAGGFFFDVIRHEAGRLPLPIYSMAGLVPLFAATVIDPATLARLPELMTATNVVLDSREYLKALLPTFVEPGRDGTRMMAVVDRQQLRTILERVLDEDQFLSAFGVRSLSRAHASAPYRFTVGGRDHEVSYQPGTSNDRMFGGNSNWRGPIWFPMNFLLIQAIDTCARYYGDDFTVECPTGSGRWLTLAEVADELAARLTRIFVRDEHGQRAAFGDEPLYQADPHWRDHVAFHEFFHGDNGAGLGASHQTGWTALVALLLQYRGRLAFERLALTAGADAPAPEIRLVQEVA
jgi:hypothetical protein